MLAPVLPLSLTAFARTLIISFACRAKKRQPQPQSSAPAPGTEEEPIRPRLSFRPAPEKARGLSESRTRAARKVEFRSAGRGSEGSGRLFFSTRRRSASKVLDTGALDVGCGSAGGAHERYDNGIMRFFRGGPLSTTDWLAGMSLTSRIQS